MKILITGSNGLLGQKIVDLCLEKNIDFIATSKGENRNSKVEKNCFASLDIVNKKEIDEVVEEFRPDVIINTAAVTNVDLCEKVQELCYDVNVLAVKNLLAVASKNNIHLIHLSTDFVFDGKNGPYKEEDERNPVSFYGLSKLRSEDVLIQSDYSKWSIVRTIIVFGIAENMSRSNIVLWAKKELEAGRDLKIVNDQFRAPTFAEDLAWACVRIAEKKAYGVYHISGPETMSILELVKRVADYFDLNTSTISAINSDSLKQPAKRPPKTGFILDKAQKDLDYSPSTFEESLGILKSQLEKN